VESELGTESRSLLAQVPQFTPTTQIGTTQTSAPVACPDALGAANQLGSCGVHPYACLASIKPSSDTVMPMNYDRDGNESTQDLKQGFCSVVFDFPKHACVTKKASFTPRPKPATSTESTMGAAASLPIRVRGRHRAAERKRCH
jgi:hypothetical protein